MPKQRIEHFDCTALVRAIYSQPIGLLVATNHPAGFRRILYKHLRRNKGTPVSILQSPKSANAFYLVRGDRSMEQLKGESDE